MLKFVNAGEYRKNVLNAESTYYVSDMDSPDPLAYTLQDGAWFLWSDGLEGFELVEEFTTVVFPDGEWRVVLDSRGTAVLDAQGQNQDLELARKEAATALWVQNGFGSTSEDEEGGNEFASSLEEFLNKVL